MIVIVASFFQLDSDESSEMQSEADDANAFMRKLKLCNRRIFCIICFCSFARGFHHELRVLLHNFYFSSTTTKTC